MIIRHKKKTAERVGLLKFRPFGVTPDSWHWKGYQDISLPHLGGTKTKALRGLLADNIAEDRFAIGGLVKDIDAWDSVRGGSDAKARNVRGFSSMLAEYLRRVPGHRIYKLQDDGVYLPYYVSNVEFNDAYKDRGGYYVPAICVAHLHHEEFGGGLCSSESWTAEHCVGKTVVNALGIKRYMAETEELRSAHLADVARFSDVCNAIGKSYTAEGIARADLDGNPSNYGSRNWFKLSRAGEPVRVVSDVFYEENEKADREKVVSGWFWRRKKLSVSGEADDEDEIGDTDKEVETPEIPIHPFCAVFDLARHLRVRVHVSYLTEYVHDSRLMEKLVLPDETKGLVRILVEHKDGGFRDIVAGKGSGAVVLLLGPPGTGKTLTAEVYAENEGRALYSVQCSQLGTEPDEIEPALLKVFERAARWGAVVLLDEADVYCRARGDNLAQNAIVGVFLRVLEYQSSVMFLTSNIPEIDDAIASRCIAKITFRPPSDIQQALIWRVLANVSGVEMTDAEIAAAVKVCPGISGRDVKNLLKLGALLIPGRPLTARVVEYVKQFKPTRTYTDGVDLPVAVPLPEGVDLGAAYAAPKKKKPTIVIRRS